MSIIGNILNSPNKRPNFVAICVKNGNSMLKTLKIGPFFLPRIPKYKFQVR